MVNGPPDLRLHPLDLMPDSRKFPPNLANNDVSFVAQNATNLAHFSPTLVSPLLNAVDNPQIGPNGQKGWRPTVWQIEYEIWEM